MSEPPQEPLPPSRQAELERENRELRALHEAGLFLQGELNLDLVLEKAVGQATELLNATYGALSVIDEDGAIEKFITCGIDSELRQRIGPLPKGEGLLGIPLGEGDTLRLSDLSRHPRAAGFPKHHPRMTSLLAVPIVCQSPYRGNLYLADKKVGGTFSVEDERALLRFARGAAAAIDTAHVHRRLESLAIAEERLRISREMHDGLAQVLAYVNTKAQAAREYLSRGRSEQAVEQLDELAAAARGVYSDVRESILALRLQPGPRLSLKEALHAYTEHWQARSKTRIELEIDDQLELPPKIELQVMRIVQEALTNIRKHAQAASASIRIENVDAELIISVVDDGVGFDRKSRPVRSSPRFGLSVMRERAEGVGGSFHLETAPGDGTSILITVPISTPEVHAKGNSDHASTRS